MQRKTNRTLKNSSEKSVDLNSTFVVVPAFMATLPALLPCAHLYRFAQHYSVRL